MAIERDLDGFRDAMARMRGFMGRDVTFLKQIEGTYPVGTQVDPETGLPFDPTIEPVGATEQELAVPANVYTAVAGNRGAFKDDQQMSAIGWLEAGNVIFDVSVSDFDSLGLDDATAVEDLGSRYKISDTDPWFVGGVEYRVLVFAKKG